MSLKYFTGNKSLANTLFVFIFLPYILLCLTMGGFHDGLFIAKQCDHELQPGSHDNHDNAGCLQVGDGDNVPRHDPGACQICQWLKTPSTFAQLLMADTHFDFVCLSPPRNSNPILPSLSIHKFTIRPPPSSSCLFA